MDERGYEKRKRFPSSYMTMTTASNRNKTY